jgi:type II secretory pathway pseudopilin PulG
MSQKAFSIIETLVAITIFSVATIAIMAFVIQNYQTLRRINEQIEAQNQARKAIKTMIKEFRNANVADTGAYTIESASSTSLVFFANIDSSSDRERIRYFLEDSELKKGVIKPSGMPIEYNPADEVITTVARYVRNLSFLYFDGNYTGTEDPLSEPINVTQVKFARISLEVDVVPNVKPDGFTLTSEVNLRNLKENL